MSIITATNLSLSFGAHDVFSGLSVTVPPQARIGLVGPNGVGKTSLLLVLAGLTAPSAGTLRRARSARIGYLPQESAQALDGQRTVYQEMAAAFQHLQAMEQRLHEMEEHISHGSGNEALLEAYGSLQERFELAGGYEYQRRIRQVLSGLGLARESHLPLDHLSGGQKTRVLLARLLLEQPDCLILDEPTNHLDTSAVEWLEGTLAAWQGAILVVSHDRYFLDRVVNTIWEMSPTGVEVYRGGYSAYVAQREERWARRHKEWRALKERFERELDFVRRNIAGQRSEMARGRLKRLSREVEALHAGGLATYHAIKQVGWLQATAGLDMRRPSENPEEVGRRIHQLRLPPSHYPEVRLHLKPARRGGDLVLRTTGLVVGHPGRPLFAADDIQLTHGECAALIGGNGTGKTTFLRTLLGQVAPLAGGYQLGANLEIGYLRQSHEELVGGRTVLDELLARRQMSPAEGRHYLAQFLFERDEVFKPLDALSGGERSRLALAILALQQPNFLLLDEPTNHLDIPAREVLQAMLEQFEGTILLVSHDRYLIDRLATQIWELADGRLRVFPGDYRQFRSEERRTVAVAGRERTGARARQPQSAGGAAQTDALSKNERWRREQQRRELEALISQLEAELAKLEAALQEASEAGQLERVRQLGDSYQAAQEELDRLLNTWAEQA